MCVCVCVCAKFFVFKVASSSRNRKRCRCSRCSPPRFWFVALFFQACVISTTLKLV